MFKIGDKVKCITSISERDGGPRVGEVYKVVSANENHIGVYCPRIMSGHSYSIDIKHGFRPNWGNQCFILIEKPPIKNDIEWLDRVQSNFKD